MTICFKLKDEDRAQAELDPVDTSRLSLDPAHSCLCLETYGSNYLGYPQLSCFILELLNIETDILGRFHNISNTTLHEIVTSLRAEWPPGLAGVSSGVRVTCQSVTECHKVLHGVTARQCHTVSKVSVCDIANDSKLK